jgi:hypothetical protein
VQKKSSKSKKNNLKGALTNGTKVTSIKETVEGKLLCLKFNLEVGRQSYSKIALQEMGHAHLVPGL